jgi:hypothetical protein
MCEDNARLKGQCEVLRSLDGRGRMGEIEEELRSWMKEVVDVCCWKKEERGCRCAVAGEYEVSAAPPRLASAYALKAYVLCDCDLNDMRRALFPGA